MDNGKVVSSSSFQITKIDTTDPTVSLDIPNNIVEEFDYKLPTSYTTDNTKSGGTVSCKIGDTEVSSTKDLKVGNYKVDCTVTTGAGKTATASKTFNVIEKIETTYDYTGAEQTYVIPLTGKYKLETWGAQGADATSTYIGGYGGYSSGTIKLDKGTTLYVNVGGKGGNYTYELYKSALAVGGYNGGGYGHVNSSNWTHRYLYAGGGASHISLSSGLLSTLKEKQDDILLVASGGGSGSSQIWQGGYYSYTKGGSGGGISGNPLILASRKWTCGIEDNNTFYATGGTQTGGGTFSGCSSIRSDIVGSFGQAFPSESDITDDAAHFGGGGGYYGGTAGAGGSGYIGNSLLTDKVMYCYNCTESNEESTKTISTTNVSAEAISNYAKMGNGYAKITYIGE